MLNVKYAKEIGTVYITAVINTGFYLNIEQDFGQNIEKGYSILATVTV